MTFEERLRTVVNDSETLAHYGVLGMKWGVRKDPKKAYQKSVKKLRKIEKKTTESSTRIAKRDQTESKARMLSSKSKRLSSAAPFAWTKIGKEFRIYRSERLKKKADKLQFKVDKQKFKVEKARTKGKKWVQSMEKTFSKVDTSSFNKEDIDYVKNWVRNNDFDKIRVR